MKNTIYLLFSLFITITSFRSMASEYQKIDTLGISAKGQFIALEEYGFKAAPKRYYVRVRVLNLWKKNYVGRTYQLEVPAHTPGQLDNARFKLRASVKEELRPFGIII
jgi:predicted secreted protein